MTRPLLHSLALLASALLAASALGQPWFNPETTPRVAATDLKPGMVGEVWTVFSGTEPEPFAVEFIGLLENELGPGKHMILCRLTDPRVQLMGAVAGMSGSPLYFDGRLAGALSYSIQIFETVRHAGFTPISDILEVSSEAVAGPLPGVMHGANARRTPLRPTFSVSGVSQKVIDAFKPISEGLGLELQAGGGSAPIPGVTEVTVLPATANAGRPLAPGDAVAVALSTGAITLAGTGTVSFTRGDELYAFGHPMMGVGSVSFPMARAEIVTIAASSYRSFKLSNTRQVVGTITQDRLSAIYGRVGPVPTLVPLKIRIHEPGGPVELDSAVVLDKDFTPWISAIALMQATSGRNANDRHEGSTLVWSVDLEGLPSLARRDILDGPSSDFAAAMQLYGMLSQLMDHPLGRARPTSINIELQPMGRSPQATFSRLTVPLGDRRAGDEISGEIVWFEKQAGWTREPFRLALPSDLPTGSYQLVALPGDELDAMEGLRTAPPGGAKTLMDVVESLRQRRRRDGLHLALVQPSQSYVESGSAISDPPESFLRVAGRADPVRGSPRATGKVILEQHLAADRVFDRGATQLLNLDL